MHNLGATYGDQRRYSEAELMLKKVLELREKKLGKEHPDTLVLCITLVQLTAIRDVTVKLN